MSATNPVLTRIEGCHLALRLVQVDDAAYIFDLRSDPTYNAYLSRVHGTVEDQRRWIEAYKVREADLRELYYVIERKDGIRCGLVRLYDIFEDSFTWGSWILDANKPAKAALESALLVYDLGFEKLGLGRAVFDVRRKNERTVAFHRRLGAIETGADTQDIFFTYPRETFLRDRYRYYSILTGGTE